MTSQRDLDIMWLEAMEEIDEVEVEFMEMLNGETSSETRGTTEITRSTDTRDYAAPSA